MRRMHLIGITMTMPLIGFLLWLLWELAGNMITVYGLVGVIFLFAVVSFFVGILILEKVK